MIQIDNIELIRAEFELIILQAMLSPLDHIIISSS